MSLTIKKPVIIASLAVAFISSAASAVTYRMQALGTIRTVEGNSAGGGVAVGDQIAASFRLDEKSFGSPAYLPVGGGIYTIYSASLTSFRLGIGSYRAISSISVGNVTYMDNSFGQDGIVISPGTLPGEPLASDRALVQFQFRGPAGAIGNGGISNGLPADKFQPSFFAIFGNAVSAERVFGDLTVSISSTVPEPDTWAVMVLGFGLVGTAARFRRRSVDGRAC